MKQLVENWKRFVAEGSVNRSQSCEVKKIILNEDFFFTDDTDRKNPLSSTIVDFLSSRLPGSPSMKDLGDLQASGAEGVVVSLDDMRVIKLFHSLENAVKNLPLVSKRFPETAQVYSVGKIMLDRPVEYFKRGSTYTPTKGEESDTIYYIIMERVTPDPYVYRYPEIAYEKYNRLSNVEFHNLYELYQLDIPELTERIDNIYRDFSKTTDTLDQFMEKSSKKEINVQSQKFNLYRKTKTKEFVVPANLKKLILNVLGIEQDFPYAENLFKYYLTKKEFSRRPKKSLTNNTVAEDLLSIIELVEKIRIEKKVPWNDIHREQFGRNKNNELVALDLGVKGEKASSSDKSAFDKNVSKLSTRGQDFKLVNESGMFLEDINRTGVKVLNVYDFDKTLFFTDDAGSGKSKYEKAFGTTYPHKGWFGKEESLSDELEIQKNNQMEAIFNALKDEPNSISVLISNRIVKLQDRLETFLKDRDFVFDEILLKKGSQTKVQRLEDVWERNQDVEKINIFDDLDSALNEYLELRDLYSVWRPEMEINIYKVEPSKIVKL